MKPDANIQQDWKWGTPEGSRELDRRLDQQLTFRQKLIWLEEAESLSIIFQRNKDQRGMISPMMQNQSSDS